MDFKDLLSPGAQQGLENLNTGIQRAIPLGDTFQQLSESFAPVKQAFDPAIQGIKKIAEPIKASFERGKNIRNINKYLLEKKVNADDIRNLAEVDGSDPEEAFTFFRENGIKIEGMEVMIPQVSEQIQQEIPSIADSFKMESSEEFGIIEGAKDIGKFFLNVPADSAQVVGGLWDAITNPIDTATSLIKTGIGISDKAVFGIANSISSALGGKTVGPTENAKMVDTIASNIVDKYGTAGKFKKAVVENPADTLLTLMGGLGAVSKVAKAKGLTNIVANIDKIQGVINPVNILKKEAKILTAPAKYGVTKILPELFGKTTGTSAETIKMAVAQGATPEFKKGLRGEITPQDILFQTKEGLSQIRDQRKILYGEDYKKLEGVTKKIAINEFLPKVIQTLENDYNIKPTFNKKGNIIAMDFSQSKITGTTSQSQIKNIVKDLKNWKDTTPKGLDILKQRIQDYYRGVDDSAKGDRISTMVSNEIKSSITKEVPEYAKMNATYEKLTNQIRDITKTLSLGDKTQSQTAITKLNSVLRDNFSARQDMIKLIEHYTGKNLQAQIAGTSLNPALAKGLAGVMVGGGAIFGQLMNPAFLAGLALASPRLIGEAARIIGISVDKFNLAINNIKKYAPNYTNGNMNSVQGISKGIELSAAPSKKTLKKISDKELSLGIIKKGLIINSNVNPSANITGVDRAPIILKNRKPSQIVDPRIIGVKSIVKKAGPRKPGVISNEILTPEIESLKKSLKSKSDIDKVISFIKITDIDSLISKKNILISKIEKIEDLLTSSELKNYKKIIIEFDKQISLIKNKKPYRPNIVDGINMDDIPF